MPLHMNIISWFYVAWSLSSMSRPFASSNALVAIGSLSLSCFLKTLRSPLKNELTLSASVLRVAVALHSLVNRVIVFSSDGVINRLSWAGVLQISTFVMALNASFSYGMLAGWSSSLSRMKDQAFSSLWSSLSSWLSEPAATLLSAKQTSLSICSDLQNSSDFARITILSTALWYKALSTIS